MYAAEVVEVVEAELVHHLDQPARRRRRCRRRASRCRPSPRPASRTLARMIAQQRLVRARPRVDELQDRDVEPFLVDVARASGPKPMPPMSMMWLVQANRPTACPAEDRRDHDEVVQVAGAHPRIVGDVDVALRASSRPGTGAMKCSTDSRHRIDVAGRAGDGLRQHAALAGRTRRPRDRPPRARSVEKAVRISVCACSSTTAIRRFHMICSSDRSSASASCAPRRPSPVRCRAGQHDAPSASIARVEAARRPASWSRPRRQRRARRCARRGTGRRGQ